MNGLFCKKCGSQLSGDSLFCVNCGAKVEQQGNASPSVFPRATPGTSPEPIGKAENPVNSYDEAMARLIGKNQDYYLKQFHRIEKGENSFNWIAFLFGPFLLLYRKQYAFFLKVFLPAMIMPFIVPLVNTVLYHSNSVNGVESFSLAEPLSFLECRNDDIYLHAEGELFVFENGNLQEFFFDR